jgi:tRNA (guanine37-N1)-methyltransferase
LARIKIITLFPEFFRTPLETGLMGKAVKSGLVDIEFIDLKLYSEDPTRRCDDYPYGGGSGMVLKTGPLSSAIKTARGDKTFVILTSPCGRLLDQETVKFLSSKEELCIVCGQYEGVDQRIIDRFVDLEVSVGDYVLSGGEYAALVIIDAAARYIPGFMSNQDSLKEESFEDDLLEYPQFTRPPEFEGERVPDVLLGGNHEEIRKWRLERSEEKTRRLRPDLYNRYLLRKIRGDEK